MSSLLLCLFGFCLGVLFSCVAYLFVYGDTKDERGTRWDRKGGTDD